MNLESEFRTLDAQADAFARRDKNAIHALPMPVDAVAAVQIPDPPTPGLRRNFSMDAAHKLIANAHSAAGIAADAKGGRKGTGAVFHGLTQPQFDRPWEGRTCGWRIGVHREQIRLSND
jgi:hypothetical protein